MKKHFYAAKSSMGINFTFDSGCWSAYVFNSKKERDEWASERENRVAVLKKEAYQIAGLNHARAVPGVEEDNQLCNALEYPCNPL